MDCRDTRSRLKTQAARLREGERADAASMALVRDHLEACPVCAARLLRRFRAVEARDALRRRAMPDGVLEGFFDGIQSRMPHAVPGGAMSVAFLDAPRALRVWRTTAVAAVAVLAFGATLVLTSQNGVSPRSARYGEVTLRDMPNGLLPSLEAIRHSGAPEAPVKGVRRGPRAVPMQHFHLKPAKASDPQRFE